MKKFLLPLLLGIAMLAAILNPPAAHAAPAPPPKISTQSVGNPPVAYKKDIRRLSASEKKYAALGDRIHHYAVTQNKKNKRFYLDYKKADKYDRGSVTARRKFAAGFQMAGGKVNSISKAEQKKVNKYKISTKVLYKKLPKNVFGAPECQGSNKTVVKSRLNFTKYFDSCKSALIIAVAGSASLLAGALAAMVPVAAPFLILVSTVMGLGAIYLGYLVATSGKMAIWARHLNYLVYAGRQ